MGRGGASCGDNLRITQRHGGDFIHVTEHEAWKPAFPGGNACLVSLSSRYAPKVALIANGGLHTAAHTLTAMEEGADIIAIGKAALANPDPPRRLASNRAIDEFDSSILGPIANIKSSELALA